MRDIWRTGETRQRGATLVFLGIALVAILGVMSLAVDLGMLYVARNDAQRAADAAALAGAESFKTDGCLALATCGPSDEPVARQQAEAVGAQDLVLEEPAQIQDNDISFNFLPNEPQITVTVARSTTRGNAVPTIFAKIFGTYLASVSASATAEAYNGPTAQGCLAPFLVPNCDPTPPPGSGAVPTPFCPSPGGEFVFPSTQGPAQATVFNGAIGQVWQLHANGAPSQWYLYQFPSCGIPSAACIGDEIEHCSPDPINCGDTLKTAPGNKLGKVTPPTNRRIFAVNAGQNGSGPGAGQDTILSPVLGPNRVGPGGAFSIPATTPPAYGLSIQVGTGNPEYSQIMAASGGAGIYSGPSPSLITLPVYDGHPLTPGNQNVVTVVGWIQLFVVDAWHSGPDDIVDSVITNISGCSTTPSSVAAVGVPIRLIRQ